MSTPIPTPAPAPFFIVLRDFKAFGLPCRSQAYHLNDLGLLNLSVDPAGRRGVTADEARRYVASAKPLAEVKRDLSANHTRKGMPVQRRSPP
jgi:hypothetical protein